MAVVSLPAGPVRRATYIAGEHLAIFRQSKPLREAWTFLHWIIRPDVQAVFSMNSGYLPVWRSVLGMKSYREFLAGDPALSAYERQMDVGLGRSPIDRHRLEINRFLAEAVENATLGKQYPKRALDEAATKANALLRDDHGAGEH